MTEPENPTSQTPTPPGADILSVPPTTAQPLTLAKPRRSVMTLVLGGVLIAGLGLGGGVLIGRATAPQSDGVAFPRDGNFAAPGAPDGQTGNLRAAGGMTQGTVKSVDGLTMTLETEDGDVTVQLSDDTRITLTGEAADLTPGDKVSVMGDKSDGTVKAQAVMEGDLAQGGPQGGLQGGPQGDPSASAKAQTN